MGWTYFEDEFPEEKETMFAKFHGTDKWKNGMFRTARYDLLFTIEHKGEIVVVDGRMVDGKPMCEYARINKDVKYIAWMPYPEPMTD